MSLYFEFMSGAGLPRSWNNAASTAPIEMSTNDSFFLQILFPKGLEAPLNTLKCVERPRKIVEFCHLREVGTQHIIEY